MDNLDEIAAAQQQRQHRATHAFSHTARSRKRPNGPFFICPNPNCCYAGRSWKQSKGSVMVIVLLLLLGTLSTIFLPVLIGMLLGALPVIMYIIFYAGHSILCPRCGMKIRG